MQAGKEDIRLKLRLKESNSQSSYHMELYCCADLYQAIDLETDLSEDREFQDFKRAAKQGNLVPMFERLFSDQLTPVLAYRCLVEQQDKELPSFLFESVVNGDQTVKPRFSSLPHQQIPITIIYSSRFFPCLILVKFS